MKAEERSQRAADLIAILRPKLDTQDDSPLCDLLARYMAAVVEPAQTHCPDEVAVKAVEASLDHALVS
jgi:hypothetical protein